MERSKSICPIRLLIDKLRALAISFKAFQNACSRDTEVAWPAILIDLFRTLLLARLGGRAIILPNGSL